MLHQDRQTEDAWFAGWVLASTQLLRAQKHSRGLRFGDVQGMKAEGVVVFVVRRGRTFNGMEAGRHGLGKLEVTSQSHCLPIWPAILCASNDTLQRSLVSSATISTCKATRSCRLVTDFCGVARIRVRSHILRSLA